MRKLSFCHLKFKLTVKWVMLGTFIKIFVKFPFSENEVYM